jgi:hypothetical protein
MMGRVDPYGSLVLTSQEMEQFIAEIDSIRDGENLNSTAVAVLTEVKRLAVICMNDSALELHLDGD